MRTVAVIDNPVLNASCPSSLIFLDNLYHLVGYRDAVFLFFLYAYLTCIRVFAYVIHIAAYGDLIPCPVADERSRSVGQCACIVLVSDDTVLRSGYHDSAMSRYRSVEPF